MQIKKIAICLEELEMKMWSLSSLLFVMNEAVKDKAEPESEYAGTMYLASEMAKELEQGLKSLREQSFELLHQPEESGGLM